VSKGPKNNVSRLFYDKTDLFEWDPNKFKWDNKTPFMKFPTKLDRDILKKMHVIPNVAVRKWSGILPASHKFRWKNV
jgi:hypothetical protein